jgi:hypothetical protein
MQSQQADGEKLKRADLVVLAEIRLGTGSGARLRRSFFDNFPHKRSRAMRLMWHGYVEHIKGGYIGVTPKGLNELKVA